MAKKAGSTTEPRRKALLVGINNYPREGESQIPPLKGCVNDALLMAKMLMGKGFGFQPGQDMRLLVDQRATRKQILLRLEWLVRDAKPGDVLVFHFSGHGGQIPLRNSVSGEVGDGWDECLIPYDHDWDNPLLDDDLDGVFCGLPSGVNLTVILDCCHAGGGLRRVRPQNVDSPKRLLPPPDLEFRAVRDIEVTPGMNYYSVTMKKEQPEVAKKFGSCVGSPVGDLPSKGILLAACKTNQLANDAFIEGDYHGALTYSLYKALERPGFRQGNVSYADWMDATKKVLEKDFQIRDQDPQLLSSEELKEWRLFSTEPLTRKATRKRAPSGAKSLVYVHGIGRHEKGYSDGWWDAMRAYVPSIAATRRKEVLWSDLVNRTSRSGKPPIKERRLAAAICDVLVDREIQERLRAADVPEGSAVHASLRDRSERGSSILEGVDDFVRYLLDEKIRKSVQNSFHRVVVPLMQRGSSIELITHSWGTVVAYESLCELEAREELPDGVVHNFFTVGSALSIPSVKRRLSRSAKAGRKPRFVERWINLDARFDVVGGPLKGNPFDVDFEYPNLRPEGCGNWPRPVCAHSSYFLSENRFVNRDIFGHFIEDR